MKTIMVSGGFDPLHPGHLELFRQARKHGDRLVVAVEPDGYVARKHKVMLPQRERQTMVAGCKYVDEVIAVEVPGDCTREISIINPSVFCVGSDHADGKFPEREACERFGIEVKVLDSIRGSSSELIARVQWDNPPVCVSALVVRDGKVLLCRRGGGNCWELPGGFVEQGETLEKGLQREFKEETGAIITDLRYHWSTVGSYQDGRQVLCVYFLASLWSEPQPTEECPEFDWLSDLTGVRMFCEADRAAFEEYRRRADLCG